MKTVLLCALALCSSVQGARADACSDLFQAETDWVSAHGSRLSDAIDEVRAIRKNRPNDRLDAAETRAVRTKEIEICGLVAQNALVFRNMRAMLGRSACERSPEKAALPQVEEMLVKIDKGLAVRCNPN